MRFTIFICMLATATALSEQHLQRQREKENLEETMRTLGLDNLLPNAKIWILIPILGRSESPSKSPIRTPLLRGRMPKRDLTSQLERIMRSSQEGKK